MDFYICRVSKANVVFSYCFIDSKSLCKKVSLVVKAINLLIAQWSEILMECLKRRLSTVYVIMVGKTEVTRWNNFWLGN